MNNGHFETSQECRVLVIYTGGTIGMVRNEQNVLVPIPNELVRRIRTYPNMHDEEYAKFRFGNISEFKPLVLPQVQGVTKRTVYEVTEYSPLLDSSDVTANEWTQIANDINESYENYDAFVILHGTDTLSFTASALSFMLENLGKTVIITGSQIPIFETRTDGRDNFTTALIIAGNYVIPEVCVLFGNKLMRGNRTVKFSSNSLDAFDSLNAAPLAHIGIDIDIDQHSIFSSRHTLPFHVHSKLDSNVGILRIFPNMAVAHLHAFLAPPMKGVVLQTFGAGNVPANRKDLLAELREACARGVIVVNCTQCPNGSVSALYLTGKILWDIGVISGFDMTPEAALTKLSYVLGKAEWSLEIKKQMIKTNLRGELTSQVEPMVEIKKLFTIVAHSLNISSSKEFEELEDLIFAAILNWALMTGDKQRIDALKKFETQLFSKNQRRDPKGAFAYQCKPYESIEPTNFRKSIGEQLCSVAAQGSVNCLKSFKLAGADISQPDASGRTALHIAALHGHVEIVKFLLRNQDQVHHTDMLGLTAMDYAKRVGRLNIVKLLSHKMNTATKTTQTSDFDSSESS